MHAAFGFVLLLLFQAPAAPPAPPATQVPASPQVSPPPSAPIVSPDPATSAFDTDAGLILAMIKADKTADYELMIRTLQEALAKDADPVRQAVAKGWRVFKAKEADEKGSVIYVHALLPATPGFDYRPSLLIDELLNGAPPDLVTKYRDAFAGPPTKLSLTELAHMSVVPVAVAPAEKAPPAKKPGGR